MKSRLSNAAICVYAAMALGVAAAHGESVQLATSPLADGLGGSSSGVYRIPAMTKATNGVVVAAFDCRHRSSKDLGGGGDAECIDTAGCISFDNAQTWSAPQLFVDVENAVDADSGESLCDVGKSTNIGDPCIVYDPVGDKFLLMGITGGGLAKSHDSDGNSLADVVMYTHGTGEDDTWQEWTHGPEGNTRSCKQMILDSLAKIDSAATNDETAINGILQGPGHGIVQRQTVYDSEGDVMMPEGAIVFPMQYFGTKSSTSGWAKDSYAFAVYSTDCGATWNATKLAPTKTSQESCVMELDDGSWVMMAKCVSTTKRFFFRSTDFVNWTECDAMVPSATCQGSCLWLGKGTDGRSRYVACFPANSDRSAMTLHFGVDASSDAETLGITWAHSYDRVVWGASYGYSALAMLDETTLGVLLEPKGPMTFLTADVAEILENEIDAIDATNYTFAVEFDDSAIRISNTNTTADQASWTITNTPTLLIPSNLSTNLPGGTRIALTSLDFGYQANDSKGVSHAKKIALTSGEDTWVSDYVVTNATDKFPTKSSTGPRLVYSFDDAGCALNVGEKYALTFLDADGNVQTSIRYTLAANASTLFSGLDFNTTYTTMFQLNAEHFADVSFDWTPGENPTGWFTSWDGEYSGDPVTLIGPEGTSQQIYVTGSNNWSPYGMTDESREEWTLATYGSADDVSVSEGYYAVLWCMGRKNTKNNTENEAEKTVLAKSPDGNICLLQLTGANTTPSNIITGPQVEGYHLFTVRFSATDGASLQIDNGEIYSDATFTQKAGMGFQVGSVRGGCSTPFVRGNGFAVLKMLGYETSDIPNAQYLELCEKYPAVTNRLLATVDGTQYYRLKYLMDALAEAESFTVTDEVEIDVDGQAISCALTGEAFAFGDYGIAVASGDSAGEYTIVSEKEVTHECVLRISEIMPKPTDDQSPGEREGMDVNGLESGWVEVENTSDLWADLADYLFIRTNRGKKTDTKEPGNLPTKLIAPHSRYVFYTSERYPNSDTPEESAFQDVVDEDDRVKPVCYTNLNNVIVYGKKVNPKKSPFVRLYYAPGGKVKSIVDTVVVPSDLPEGWSIIVGDVAEGEATTRWMCPSPTRGKTNTDTAGLTRIGPNAGPLYEISSQKKHSSANEFARTAPPAIPGEDYEITFSFNPVMCPTNAATFRSEDAITNIVMYYRTDLTNAVCQVPVDTSTGVYDKSDWGYTYTTKIPASALPEQGHLVQWKFVATDACRNDWTSPSFNNPDDGYEWYGTIVEPSDEQMSATLPTWHLFASGYNLTQMDVDADKQTLANNARVAIYDSSTSNYYDYVRIDLRGHTSANFTKKGHGLRFAKAHPLTMVDSLTGEEIEDIRKTSLISEYADPSLMRQMIAFWLWRRMGNLVPFDFPVRCNLNGEFYQLAFNSERFTDELIEDVYGLDKFGYSYKNVGTLKSGSSTTAGSIEKKTPDDEDESNITILENELRVYLKQYGAQDAAEDTAALTKFVVKKFNLPAWLNYLAAARITQEMDDVWANICAYYDNAEMHADGGVRGTDAWMPLGYDFNLTFGQYYHDKSVDVGTLMSNHDWFKSHPFYGGNRVRCYTGEAMSSAINYGNDGFEAIYQSSKFRRLYLRRLRTLMDEELKAPGTAMADTPFYAKMLEMAELMRSDAELDFAKWPNDSSDDSIDAWRSTTRPSSIDEGVQDIWDNYVVPRREHLYVTHSVTNTAWEIGYGSAYNAGIPESQSDISVLAPNITLDLAHHADGYVVVSNANDEVVDMSDWILNFGVDWTLPPGTVCDSNDCVYIVADRRQFISDHEDALTDQVIVGNASFADVATSIFETDGGVILRGYSVDDETIVFTADSAKDAASVASSFSSLSLSEDDVAAGLDDDYLDYLMVVANPVDGTENQYTLSIEVNPATVQTPVFATDEAAASPISVESDDDTDEKKISATISNAAVGLWYGYEVADSLGDETTFSDDTESFERATTESHTITSSPRTESSGFFRVKALPSKP